MKKLITISFLLFLLQGCGGGGGSGSGSSNPFTAPAEVTIGINEPVVILPTASFVGPYQCSADGGTGDNTLYFLSGVWNVTGDSGMSGVKLTGLNMGSGTVRLSCWADASIYPGIFTVTTTVNVTSSKMISMKVSPDVIGLPVNVTDSVGVDFSIIGYFNDGSTKVLDKSVAVNGDTNGNGFGDTTLGDGKFIYNMDGSVNYVGGSETPETLSYTISNGAWIDDGDNVGSVYLAATLEFVIGYPASADIQGRWQYIHDGVTKKIGEYTDIVVTKIDTNHISTIGSDGSVYHLIRAGISNVKLKGKLKSFATAAAPKSISKKAGLQRGVTYGGIELIIDQLNCYKVEPATITNPAGELVEASVVGECPTAYVDETVNGELDLGSNTGIVTSTGQKDIIITDSGGNVASFGVEIIGEESDMGVLNIPEASVEYNFKSKISHLNDYVYFGALPYSKTVKICNTGLSGVDGMTMSFSVDAADEALVRSFTHNYNGAATSFPSGTCLSYSLNVEFNRPVADDDVKINIDITNNFTSVTWSDYVTFNLSSLDPVPLYFASNTKLLNGYLVAPGRQLVKVSFSGVNINTNFIRIPADLNSEYELVLSASNITDADTYMLSTVNAPDTSLFTGFSDVTIYEPDDDYTNATSMSYFGTEHIAYLAAGDIDFYRIFNY